MFLIYDFIIVYLWHILLIYCVRYESVIHSMELYIHVYTYNYIHIYKYIHMYYVYLYMYITIQGDNPGQCES
jgi:hypothetical protein